MKFQTAWQIFLTCAGCIRHLIGAAKASVRSRPNQVLSTALRRWSIWKGRWPLEANRRSRALAASCLQRSIFDSSFFGRWQGDGRAISLQARQKSVRAGRDLEGRRLAPAQGLHFFVRAVAILLKARWSASRHAID